jgi:hypothetical protein
MQNKINAAREENYNMAKKLLIVWLSLTILIFSSASVFAEEIVRGEFFLKNIVINNEKILNYQADNPFFVYNNLTYIPLNNEMSNILGLSWDMNLESRTLSIKREDPTQQNFSQRWMKSNLKPVDSKLLSDISIVLIPKMAEAVTDASIQAEVTNSQEQVVTEEPKVETDVVTSESDSNLIDENIVGNLDVSNEAVVDTTPGNIWVDPTKVTILTSGDVIYVPIGMLAANKEFGIDVYYEPYSGLYITTDGVTSAKSTFNETESKLNKGLVNYVIRANGSYSAVQAQKLVFLFKNEARIYNMDPILMLSVAHKESTFTAAAKSRSGALGMMQVMPKTAARYGFTAEEMYNVHNSIEFGTLYLKERLDAYGGSVTKALSAYNQGSVRVNRGSYSPRYANAVMMKYNNIISYLKTNGYVTQE